jgi:DHA2 family multidrug resistance protein
MPIVGASLNKVGARALITVGSVIVGAATLLLSQVTLSTGWMDFFWPLLIRGFGMGFMFVPLSVATLGSLPKKDIPAAAGFFNLTRTIGGSVGVALMATVLSQRQAFHFDRLIENVSIYNPATQQFLNQVQAGMVAKGLDTNAAQQAAIVMLNRNLHAQASILSFEDIYKIVAWMFFLCLPLVFFLGKGNPGKKSPRMG